MRVSDFSHILKPMHLHCGLKKIEFTLAIEFSKKNTKLMEKGHQFEVSCLILLSIEPYK